MKVLAKLRVSLITRDFTHFRSWLSGCASTEDREAVASQSRQAVAWLTDIVCDQHGDEALWNTAFLSLRLVGPAVFPTLRKAYDREKSLVARGRLHMCMMDIINRAGASAKQSFQMSPLAEREIPKWLEALRTAEPRVRGWAVMILFALIPYAPAHIEQVRDQLSDFLTADFSANDDLSGRDFAAAMQDYAARALSDLPQALS